MLDGYHDGKIEQWVEFFLDGVAETANSSIKTCAEITKLREDDMMKIQRLNRVASEVSQKILIELYKMPIVGIGDIKKWTGYTERVAIKQSKGWRNLEYSNQSKKGDNVYAQKWAYHKYLDLFNEKN